MPPIVLLIPFLLAVFAMDPATQQSEPVPVALNAPAAEAPAPAVTPAVAKVENVEATKAIAAAVTAAPPPVMDIGSTAFGLAVEHLNAGRLASATYYFDQSARNNYKAPDSYESLATIQYRLDNVEQGDRYLAQSGREGGALTVHEREAALARLKMRQEAAVRLGVVQPTPASPELVSAPEPAPAPMPVVEKEAVAQAPAPVPAAEQPAQAAEVASAEAAPAAQSAEVASAEAAPAPVAQPADPSTVSPGASVGARGCAVLLTAHDNSGATTGKMLAWEGVSVDCLARDNGPAPKVTTIWFNPRGEEQARIIAAALPNAKLQPVLDLDNDVEVRLAQSAKTRR